METVVSVDILDASSHCPEKVQSPSEALVLEPNMQFGAQLRS